MLIAIRNFMDYNYILKNNLIKTFLSYSKDNCNENEPHDVKIESLRYFKDIKNWAIYMHKDAYV